MAAAGVHAFIWKPLIFGIASLYKGYAVYWFLFNKSQA